MTRKLGRRWKNRLLAALVLALPLLSACGMSGGADQKTAAVDPPPQVMEEAMMQETDGTVDAAVSPDASAEASPAASPASSPAASSAASPATADAEDSVTVYLLDRNDYLAPMTMHLPAGASSSAAAVRSAETALTWLTADHNRNDQLPAGFTAVVPEEMKSNSVKLDADKGTVSIDFAAPLAGMAAAQERKWLEAIVWTMTELPGIDKVRLSVEGKPVRMLPSSRLPVDAVLTRGIGINLEQAQGVQMSRSMAVTLYFSGRTDSGDGYFIPVTRLIARTQDRMGAALNQLIEGPMDKQNLQPVLTPGVTVDKLSRMADTVNVSLHDEGWTPDTTVPAEMMEALVLTVTETTGAPQVKVAMNGDDSFLDSDQRSYDRPVTRPTVVNLLKR